MVKRSVKISKTHTFFLFGARGTGISTLIEHEFPRESAIWVDLLDQDLESRLAAHPEVLRSIIEAEPQKTWVVIDEIQKVPALLNVVQSLAGKTKLHFVLTGSSARKLRRGAANLLAGRAFTFTCHPLLHSELAEEFSLQQALQFGTLPGTLGLSPQDKADYLRSYVETYFREEIVAEQVVRKLKPFRSFLSVAA